MSLLDLPECKRGPCELCGATNYDWWGQDIGCSECKGPEVPADFFEQLTAARKPCPVIPIRRNEKGRGT